jgi:hypothetical protein
MFPIQTRQALLQGDIKLGGVGIFPAVGHADHTQLVVLQLESSFLVVELAAVNRITPGAIACCNFRPPLSLSFPWHSNLSRHHILTSLQSDFDQLDSLKREKAYKGTFYVRSDSDYRQKVQRLADLACKREI